MAFKGGFKAEANRIALRIRKQMGLDAISPIDPFALCKLFDIHVFPLSALDNQSSFYCVMILHSLQLPYLMAGKEP